MINIKEHLEKYPCIRLPNGHSYPIKTSVVHRTIATPNKKILSVRIGSKWITTSIPEDERVSWKELRRIRREYAVMSESQWRIR